MQNTDSYKVLSPGIVHTRIEGGTEQTAIRYFYLEQYTAEERGVQNTASYKLLLHGTVHFRGERGTEHGQL